MALAASILGSAQGFLDVWIERVEGRMLTGGARMADDALSQRRLAVALWDLDAAITVMRDVAQTMWIMAEARETPTMTQRARLRWNMNRGLRARRRVVRGPLPGRLGRTAFVDHPLHSRFQDLQTGLGHAFLVPDPLAKAVGGEVLGTEKPELVL